MYGLNVFDDAIGNGSKSLDPIQVSVILEELEIAPLSASPPHTQTATEAPPPTATANNPPVLTDTVLSEEDARKMKLLELKADLEKRAVKGYEKTRIIG